MVDTAPRTGVTPSEQDDTNQVPNLSGDIRHLVPPLGLRNYWYPAILDRRIPRRRPIHVDIMGEEVVFFRGLSSQPVALSSICPHRGARLSEGKCHWAGTIACHYHGWVFDENGNNVAVLSEGPDSKVCGKPGTEAKVYPVQVHKGVVFIWIGDTDPAPIQEDVPPKFFDPNAYVFANDHIYWKTGWLTALENSMDSHVSYLHRDNVYAVMAAASIRANMGTDRKLKFVGQGFRIDPAASYRDMGPPSKQDHYPNGWKWPKHRYRRLWAWLFDPIFSTLLNIPVPKEQEPELWGPGHSLPSIHRQSVFGGGAPGRKARFRKNQLLRPVGVYTRWCVAIEPLKTRVWYFHLAEPKNWFQKIWFKFLYNAIHRWLLEYNFSQQDGAVMVNQHYDSPERLSGTDAGVIQLRKLVVTKAYGGRHAPFNFGRQGEAEINDSQVNKLPENS